ncbi:MAG: nucleotidyltransferase domain-containing protein [Lachnospiraceae bacterium]|nr:nucleotidyltransferase domain-containing protein [Lachnospiraceae bacterium]MCM1236299.1 nucleotidyltransferase domain-containing protein [Ruminococcus flavefaciens]
MKLTFKDIENNGLLLYRYIRGSHVYGTNVDGSDIDEGGIYIVPNDQLLDLGFDYQNEISDEKHDTCWWELGKFMKLLLTSNPTVLEALFIPNDKVLYEHPIITEIKKHKDEFITKQCFMPLGGYAYSQIKKSQGQSKKIHWDITQMTRKTPLDFCYTFDDNQGSINIQTWLSERGLDQRNCGLVNIPNMPTMYGLYYDFGQHIELGGITESYFYDVSNYDNGDKFIKYVYNNLVDEWYRDTMNYEFCMNSVYKRIKQPIGKHCGIISSNNESNEIRFSETKKGETPICFMSYNENGYRQHCKRYREYEDWKQNRNKARYENNLEGKEKENVSKFYDSKNMCHCFRLIAMSIEVAKGEGLKLDRRGIDADFLLDVRNRKYTYDELMDKLISMKETMDIEIEKSTIPEQIDKELINSLLLDMRKKFWEGHK